MKKLLILSFVLVLMLGAALPGVLAQSPDDLNGLATLFPDDTALFISLRTDQDFIDGLDSAIDRLSANLSTPAPPDVLAAGLDMLALAAVGGDFDTSIRPWLGDSASLGLTNLQGIIINPALDDPGVLVAIAINDREAAADFIRKGLESGGSMVEYSVRTTPDAIYFTPDDDSNAFVTVTDDAIVLSSSVAEKELRDGIESSLADSSVFVDTMTMLPEDTYGLTIYFDTEAVLDPVMAMASEEMPGGMGFAEFLISSSQAVGPMALGLTQVSANDFTLDVVQVAGDTSGLEELGLAGALDLPPIDPAFAANIPGDAEFVIHGTGLGPSVTAAFDGLRAYGSLLQDLFSDMLATGELEPEAEFLTRINFGSSIIGFTNLAFAGLTGMSLQEDVLAWMTDDFVFFADIILDDANTNVVDFEAALAIRASDPEAALAVVDGLAFASEQLEIPATRTTLGNAEAIIMSNPLAAFLPDNAPPEAFDILAEDTVVAVNADVFAVGQQDSLDFVLSPLEADSLFANPQYTEAVDLALDDASMLLYLTPQPLLPMIEASLANVFSNDERDALTLLGALNSLSLSSIVDEDGSSVTRIVVAMAE